MAGLTVSVPVSFDTSAGKSGGSDTARLSSHPVVEAILPAVMKRMTASTKLNSVSELKMREVLNNVVTNKVHIKLPHPHASSNHPEAVLLYDALRSSCGVRGLNHTRELWRQFVSTNAAVFELLFQELRRQRPAVAAAEEPVGTKRRRTGDSSTSTAPGATVAPGPSGGPSTALTLPPSGVPALDAAELAVMGDDDKLEPLKMDKMVLAFLARPDFQSPPSSPRRPPRVVVPTCADRLLRAHMQTRDSRPSLTNLFEAFDLDGCLVPETYTPAFDRNDLYLSNAASALRMYERARTWCTGDAFLFHVLISYNGPMDISKEPFTCAYATWCWEDEVTTLLSRVLAGTVRLNDDFSRLLDRVAKLHHGANIGSGHDVHIHRFFSLAILQTDIAPPASDADLPSFLCDLACVYSEVRSDCRDATHIGLNHSPVLFARHRLIYESGSLQNYRLTWMLIAAKKQLDKAVSQLELATVKAAHTLVTLQHELHEGFQGSFPLLTPRSKQEIQVLAKLCLDMCATAFALHRDAQAAVNALQAIATEHNKHVQAAYGAARVEQYCNGVPIPRALLLLYNSVMEQDALYTESERVNALHTGLARVHKSMQALWFMQLAGSTLTSDDKVGLLHALALLKLWQAQPVSDELRTAPLHHFSHLPEPPPNSIRMKVVQKAYRKACLKQHPDRNKEAEATGRMQQLGHARTLVVNHLVPASSRSRSRRSDSVSSG